MTVDKLRDLSRSLERHETAFGAQGGFEDYQGYQPYYLGYGGQLTLPDGRSYAAYAKGWASTLRISFIGANLKARSLLAEIGLLKLFVNDDDVTLESKNIGTRPRTHEYPDIAELARPFGAWVVESILRGQAREQANELVYQEQDRGLRELTESVRNAAGDADEATLIGENTARLVRIVGARRSIQPPGITVPSLAEVALLDQFVSNPGNTTAGYVHAYDARSAYGLHIAHVAGPLLS